MQQTSRVQTEMSRALRSRVCSFLQAKMSSLPLRLCIERSSWLHTEVHQAFRSERHCGASAECQSLMSSSSRSPILRELTTSGRQWGRDSCHPQGLSQTKRLLSDAVQQMHMLPAQLTLMLPWPLPCWLPGSQADPWRLQPTASAWAGLLSLQVLLLLPCCAEHQGALSILNFEHS